MDFMGPWICFRSWGRRFAHLIPARLSSAPPALTSCSLHSPPIGASPAERILASLRNRMRQGNGSEHGRRQRKTIEPLEPAGLGHGGVPAAAARSGDAVHDRSELDGVLLRGDGRVAFAGLWRV